MEDSLGARWTEVESVFLEVSSLPKAEQAGALRRRCGDDIELLSSVEKLLEHDSTNTDFLGPILSPAEIGVTDNWIGREVGSYRIAALLGRGGMGAVYRAERGEPYRKEVAIKVLRFDTGEEGPRRRFRQERQILALLEHPNIARPLDGGNTPEGAPYLVMEYVSGQPLLNYCQNLPLEARIDLFRAICEAVHYAHQHLVIHRDIKPGNILIAADGTPRLLDFGVAKLIEPYPDSGDGPATVSTRIMTPEYASPEQVRGEAVTTATDVYALGCVLYEMLTGQRAHRITSRDPVLIAQAVCEDTPPLPSTVAGSSLHGDLDTIVMKALQKDPARRYRSVQDFAEDLRRYREGRPVLARPDTIRYRAGKFARRNRWAITAVVAIILALSGGLWSARQQAQIAQSRFQQVRQLANKVLFDVYGSIANLPGAVEARRVVVATAMEYLNALSKDATNDPGLAWELAEAYTRVAEVQGLDSVSFGRHRDALESSFKATQLAEAVLAKQGLTDAQKERLLVTYDNQVFQMTITLSEVKGARQVAEKAMRLSEALSPLVYCS